MNYLRIILNLACTRKQNLHNDEVTTAALCTVLILLIVYKFLQSKLLLGGPDTISQSTLHTRNKSVVIDVFLSKMSIKINMLVVSLEY